MGTEILRPQDCLAERFHLSPSSFHHRRKYSPATGNGRGFTGNNHLHPNITNYNYYGYRNPVVRPVHRKKPQHQETTNPKRLGSFDDFKESHVEYDTITILRRGASLDSINVKIKKDHNNNNMYAGSAFSVSPSPSDLPLPTFFKKHQSFHDSASRDLKRLLRLE